MVNATIFKLYFNLLKVYHVVGNVSRWRHDKWMFGKRRFSEKFQKLISIETADNFLKIIMIKYL